MRLIRPSLFAFAAIVLLGIPAAFLFLNWRSAEITAYVWNEDSKPHLLRVIDNWSGDLIQTGLIPPRSVAVVYHGRPDEWWASPDTAGDRRHHDVRVEVLGAGCELVSSTRAGTDHGGRDVAGVFEGGSTASAEWPAEVGLDDTVTLLPVADPCAGSTPVPRGIVVNVTRVAINVGHGLVVLPCATVVVHPGDLPDGAVADPPTPHGSVRVVIPSIDAQDERWPIVPRTVIIGADSIDDSGFVTDSSDVRPCYGRPKPGATVDQ
jgi:hypothetical protein